MQAQFFQHVFKHGRHCQHPLHAVGHGRRGGHVHGAGSGRGGRGFGDDMPRGRKFSSEDLQLLLLALIEQQPRHGYELIKALSEHSNGFYSPSPGMVYPALTYLEEIDYATVETEGSRKRYALAAAGREYLQSQRERVDLILGKLKHMAHKMDSVRRAFAGEAVDENSELDGWLPELIKARYAIKRALYARQMPDAAEQLRVAEILQRAAEEIEQANVSQGGEHGE